MASFEIFSLMPKGRHFITTRHINERFQKGALKMTGNKSSLYI